MKKSDVLLAFLGGAAVGAIAGILFAPDKGSETRKKIAKAAKYLGDGISERLDDLKDSVSSTIEDIKASMEKEEKAAKETKEDSDGEGNNK